VDDGGGALRAAGLSCGSCGTGLPPNSKFCNECGAPVTQVSRSAEYKQVTVLFADVVHSMEIAATVGAERLREIMAELADRCAAVVQRFGGTVDKFTGDGIMATFGAPVALEDHAVRACLAALGVQEDAQRLAVEVRERDGVDLQLRVGLNSGQVIAGEIGSGPFGYTAVGEQVGMAQRMESVAAPGAVMLSESTARLVEGTVALREPQLVRIKGIGEPVPAHRLLGMAELHGAGRRAESSLVGRRWELSAVEALLDRAVDGQGAVVGLVGPPGIGKSRLVREVAAIARRRGVEVFTAFCESHTSQIPFHAVARLLRAATGVEGLDAQVARDRVRDRVSDADPEDLLLFDDLLGIVDPNTPLPPIDADARRRRLTALVNAASLASQTPAVYAIEDVHWIDEVSESMLADFLTVISQTPSLVLVTYRPEYEGALARVHGAQSVALAPLSDPETAALITELLGPDPSVDALGQRVAERAAGNPFFAEEIVRALAERGELVGETGAYISTAEVTEVSVPATLQATIAARIDRLPPEAKRTLSAAAVIGSRFNLDPLTQLGVEPAVDELVSAQFIDQVKFTRQPEFVFHHPLIRAVAYEAQLKADRAEMHGRVAAAIEERDPASVDENAALIAEHLEAAGELHAAYGWHMRAATWATNRDIVAARTGWRRARQVADRLPEDDPDRLAMQIAPRTLLCGTTFREEPSVADTGFDELRELCRAADDQRSMAIGIAGLMMERIVNASWRDSSRLATELVGLLRSIGDPTLTVALSTMAIMVKHDTGEMAEALRLAELALDTAEYDPAKGQLIFESPLAVAIAMRGVARSWLGIAGWKDDFHQAIATVDAIDPTLRVGVIWYVYGLGIRHGVLLADATAMRDTAEILAMAQQSGDDLALVTARAARGITLVHQDGEGRDAGFDMLRQVREAAFHTRFKNMGLVVDIHIAREKARFGDLDSGIELARTVVEYLFTSGGFVWLATATAVFVETLLQRGDEADLKEAQITVDRLATVTTDSGLVLHGIWLLRLRALLAHAKGDDTAYRDYRDRYRAMATELGFEGHIEWAEAMP
jgi:class 3 adenylate cyclase